MGIYEKWKGNNYIKRRKVFLLVQIAQHSDANSKHFAFWSSIHQFSSHNYSFLAYFSKFPFFGVDKVVQAQYKAYFTLFLTFQDLRHKMCKAVPLVWQLWVYFKVALFILLFTETRIANTVVKRKNNVKEIPLPNFKITQLY